MNGALVEAAELVSCPSCSQQSGKPCIYVVQGQSKKLKDAKDDPLVLTGNEERGPHQKRVSVAKKLGLLQRTEEGIWFTVRQQDRTTEQRQIIASMKSSNAQKIAIHEYHKCGNRSAKTKAAEVRQNWIAKMKAGKGRIGRL